MNDHETWVLWIFLRGFTVGVILSTIVTATVLTSLM